MTAGEYAISLGLPKGWAVMRYLRQDSNCLIHATKDGKHWYHANSEKDLIELIHHFLPDEFEEKYD